MNAAVLFLVWCVPGYIGSVWLVKKGYLGELTGCAVAAGGMLILFPAVLGPLLLLAAYTLPDKVKSAPIQPTLQMPSISPVAGPVLPPIENVVAQDATTRLDADTVVANVVDGQNTLIVYGNRIEIIQGGGLGRGPQQNTLHIHDISAITLKGFSKQLFITCQGKTQGYNIFGHNAEMVRQAVEYTMRQRML